MIEENGWLTKISVAALLAGMVICFWELTAGSPSPRESIFLSTGLTVLSLAGSWFASKHYSEQSYNRNLQMFGLKASEKVNNLSNELNKLSVFLQQELDSDGDEPAAEALISKRLKMEAAIHVLGTLKTMNEGSLSDWQAVIGDEITEQKERQEAKEETLREVVEMMKSLPASAPDHKHENVQTGEREAIQLQKEIGSIRSEVRMLATQVSGVPFKKAKPKARKEKVQKECVRCGKMIEYSQRTKANSVKAFDCVHCGCSLYSRESDGGFLLKERKPTEERLACPSCGLEGTFSLDPVPGGSADFECDKCHSLYRAVRRAKDVSVKAVNKNDEVIRSPEISEELLGRVRDALGPQPWPGGKARDVAAQLGISRAIAHHAVEQLIRRGDFRLQLNGRLYEPVRIEPKR